MVSFDIILRKELHFLTIFTFTLCIKDSLHLLSFPILHTTLHTRCCYLLFLWALFNISNLLWGWFIWWELDNWTIRKDLLYCNISLLWWINLICLTILSIWSFKIWPIILTSLECLSINFFRKFHRYISFL